MALSLVPQDQGGQDAAPQTPMEQFSGLPWGAPEAQDWARDAATRVNAYEQQQALANANDQAGANFVRSVDSFRRGLVSRTQADPHFVNTALDLVPTTIGSLIDAHPGLGPEDKQTHHDALVSDLNNQIARAAVQGMADRNAASAHAMMADARIGGALSDDDKQGLTSYIGLQDVARNADAAAQRIQQRETANAASTSAAIGHASALYDGNFDTPDFRPGWAQQVMRDPATQPADKATLMHLYARMQMGGDAQASDPITVQRALSGQMGHRDILGEAGNSLRLADAVGLAHTALPLSTLDRAHFAQAADTIQQARNILYGPNGENGAAGHAAWGRFVNWMLPTLRLGGANLQDPNMHPLNWINRFQPTGNDVVPRAPANRRPLSEIFGR